MGLGSSIPTPAHVPAPLFCFMFGWKRLLLSRSWPMEMRYAFPSTFLSDLNWLCNLNSVSWIFSTVFFFYSWVMHGVVAGGQRTRRLGPCPFPVFLVGVWLGIGSQMKIVKINKGRVFIFPSFSFSINSARVQYI